MIVVHAAAGRVRSDVAQQAAPRQNGGALVVIRDAAAVVVGFVIFDRAIDQLRRLLKSL